MSPQTLARDDAPTPDLERQIYRRILLVRTVELRIKAEYGRREMRSPPHLYLGHEAVAAGVSTALRADDIVCPYYRSHGWYLAKGGNLKALIAELHGRKTGCSRGWGGSMHVIDLSAGVYGTSAIVAGTVSHAAGVALALRMQGRDSVVVASFGDAAAEEGIFHETLNFANLPRRKLPVVFICENNLYATNTHIDERQAEPTGIYRHAERFGIPGLLVDGNDALAVHAAAVTAVGRARSGAGPTLIECRTYRWLEHCGVFEDTHLGYRTAQELDEWRARDPLIVGRSLVSEDEARAMAAELGRAVDEAFEWARGQPWPASLLDSPEGAA